MAASFPMTWADTWCEDLGHDRADLAGHDRGALEELGQDQLGQPGPGARPHPADVVGDLVQLTATVLRARTAPPGRRGRPGPRTGGPEATAPGRWRRPPAGAPGPRTRGGVEAGATAVPPSGTLRTRTRASSTGPPLAHLGGVAGELLAEGDRDGVHQVGPPRLGHVAQLGRLGLQRPGQRPRAGSRSLVAAWRAARWTRSGRCRWRTGPC